ncbi:MAG: hypothetical protein KAS17_04740 [Victivallaceae bacterium]|nr:hypothetical protein [Victivallaceae bacterium]
MAVKRNKKVVVKVSQFEYEQLKINAAERTLSVPVFLKLEGLNCGTGTKRAFSQYNNFDNKKLRLEKAAS